MADPQLVPVDYDPFAQGGQPAQQPSQPQPQASNIPAPTPQAFSNGANAPTLLVPVDHDPFAGQGAQGQAGAPSGDAVYFSDGQAASAGQTQAWKKLVNSGAIDPSKPWGDPAKPYVRRPDDSLPEGASYIDFDGQVKQVPQAIGAQMPIAQAQAFSNLQAKGQLDLSKPEGDQLHPIAYQWDAALPKQPGRWYIQPDGQLHQTGETVRTQQFDAFGTPTGYSEEPYLPPSHLSYGQQMANVGGALDTAVHTIVRGVPILGPAARYGNAATAATLGPVVEPMLDKDPNHSRWQDVTPGGDQAIVQGMDPSDSWMGRFNRGVAMQNAGEQQVDARHPILSATGQGLGTGVSMLAGGELFAPVSGPTGASAGGLWARSAAGAADGALIFGPDGYLRGTGAWNDPSRLRGAEWGGAGGALGGSVAPWLQAGGEAAWNAGRDLLSPSVPVGAGTADDLARVLMNTRGGASATGAASAPRTPQEWAEGIALGKNGAPSTVRPSDVAGAVTRVGRAAQRSGQTVDQLLDTVSAMGPDAMLADAPGMADLARATADRSSGGQQILEQNLNDRQLGTRDQSTGLWDRSPASMRIVNAAAEGMGIGDRTALTEAADLADAQRQASSSAYAKAYAAPPVSAEMFGTFAGPDLDAAYARARQISQREFVTMPDGSQRLQPLAAQMPDQLDWRTLDLMKQGMDDMVGEGARQGIGANDQNAMRGFRDRFRGRLDELNPDYAAARQAYAGPAAVSDAINAGKSFMSDNPEGTAATFNALSPSEQDGFRLGAWQSLRDRLGNTDVTRNAAQAAGYLKPDQQARLQVVFPDQGAFADFSAKVGNENTFANTRQIALGGSRTSRNLAAQEDASENPIETAAHVAGAAHGNHESWLALAAKALPKPGQMSEGTANALGAILGTPGAAQDPSIRELLQSAFQAQAAKEAARAVAPRVGTAVGSTTGRAAQPAAAGTPR